MAALADATIEQVKALDGLTDALVEIDRTISRLLAAREGLLALGSRLADDVARSSGAEDFGELSARAVAAEFAAALRVSDRTVQRRMGEAEWKIDRFPAVWAAQGAGRISAAHAHVIVDAGEHLQDAGDRDAYAQQLIGFAETESPNRVGRMARRVAERFQPRTIDDRHTDAREHRRVWVTGRPDGMAELGLLGPATLVHGVFDRITSMGKTVQTGADADAAWVPEPVEGPAPEDPRTLDEARCDLALDLLLTGAPTGHDTPEGLLTAITGTVSVTVPALTLMGADTTPAELDRHTPIDTATARTLAGAASGWDRILTHPVTGAVLAVDRYRPTADLKRRLLARDQRCRFPGCGIPASHSDLDHTTDAALGGQTADTNLGALCRRHHVLKHHTPWHVEHLHGGVFAWTSPTGRTYIDRPPPANTLTFTEQPEPTPEPDPPF